MFGLIVTSLGIGFWLTTNENGDVVVFPAEFVARTEKEYVPETVGVPEMTPVCAFKAIPGGSAPIAVYSALG